MKSHLVLAMVASLIMQATHPAFAQTSVQISYEIVRKMDPAGIRIMINGEQVKPGDPNFPADIPDTRAFGQKVLFSGNFASENRDEQNSAVRTLVNESGSGRAPQVTNLGRPFEEHVFIDLANQKTITRLTIGKDKEAKTYQAESPIQRADGWQITDQTKKIAGYNCRKAMVNFQKQIYTIWFTTDLPFTYSPTPELTPEKGVVLLIEGNGEQAKAVKINTNAIDPKDVQPDIKAASVTAEKLKDLREKAMADFRQQIMMGERN